MASQAIHKRINHLRNLIGKHHQHNSSYHGQRITRTTLIIILLLLLLLATVSCCHGLHSAASQYAKYSPSLPSSLTVEQQQQQQQQQKVVIKSGGPGGSGADGGGFNQPRFDYSATSAVSPPPSSSSLSSTNNHEWNPHLDVNLIDVEPEANLFLDETYFQLQQQRLQQQQTKSSIKQMNVTANKNESSSMVDNGGKFVDIRHFALTHSASSVTLRATYGPFTARKTINPFSVGQNASSYKKMDDQRTTTDAKIKTGSGGAAAKTSNIQNNISEQINAYLVTKEVRRSHPVLRVLFYASHLFELRSNVRLPLMNDRNEKSICAVVIVQFHGERLFGTCSPSENRMNACLAEIVIPALYWPPLDVTNGGVYAAKQQKSSVAKVFYTVAHIGQNEQCNDQNFLSLLASPTTSDDGEESVSDLFSAEHSMNLIHLSDVFLVPFRGSYEEVTNDNVVTVLIPQEPVYPNSKIYIPVKYTYNPEYPVSAFSLRVQVKPGLRILGAQLSHPNKLWQLSIELGPGQTSATVTAFLRDYDQNSPQDSQSLPDELLENVSQEVYSWLIEITEDVNINEMNGRIVWQLLYETETESFRNHVDFTTKQNNQQSKEEHFEKESVKLTSLIDIQKDVMQEIIAITNSKELLNTAILNGKQVSRTMRIYQVSAAGRINDITFQCSCQSVDESILKVSTSCTSVYLDGSELRGSQNATILIKYGSFIGQGNFIVWMPLMPLDVRVSDSKLSQIKSWRVHRHVRYSSINQNHYGQISSSPIHDRFAFIDQEMLADQPIYRNGGEYWSESFISNPLTQTCQLKFQQARVEVFTRYLSSDHDSGREASLINRRHSIRITQIVQNLIRVSDKKILGIRGNVIEGISAGIADVEVISPITGAVIGSKQVEVTLDRETITKMQVRLISGIKMDVEPVGQPGQSIWMVKTSFDDTLVKQYQEALLDAKLFFSDRTSMYLSEISPTDYHLTISTFKGVVDNVTRDNVGYSGSYSEMTGSYIHEMPRIIALMPGQGELVHLTLDVIRACQKKKAQPLASTYVNVDVNFELPEAMFSLQNDAIHYRRYGNNRHHSINQTTKSLEFVNKFLNPMNSLKKRFNSKDQVYRDSIRFQRHSIGSLPPTSSNPESSTQFGILSLISIICIACVILAIYSVFTSHFRTKNSSTVTTTRVMHDFKPYLSCLNGTANACPNANAGTNQPSTRTSVSAVRDWVWISKEELENENSKIVKERHKKLLTPLLPAKDYLQQQQQSDSSEKENSSESNNNSNIHITINPSEEFTFISASNKSLPIMQMPQEEDDETKMKKKNNGTKTNLTNRTRENIINNNNIDLRQKSSSSSTSSHLNHKNGTCQFSMDVAPPIPSRTRHIPIPKHDRKIKTHHQHQIRNKQIHNEFMVPPIPLHQTKKMQTHHSNQRNTSLIDSVGSIMEPMVPFDELDPMVPPPIPPHRNNNSRAQPIIRPSELSFAPSMVNSSSTSIKSQDDIDHQLRLDYKSMMKMLNKLKESDA